MNKRGSITLEAAVVMPIVLAVSVLMIYFVLIYYEKAALSAFCHNYAEAIAKYSNAKYITESEANQIDKYFYQDKLSWKVDLSQRSYRYPVYWRFFSNYIPKESDIAKKLEARMIFKNNSKLRVEKKTEFLSSYIVVTGEKRIREIVPLLQVLGIKGDGVFITTQAKVAMFDQPELIRNISLLQDAVKLTKAGKVMEEIKANLKKSLDKLLK
ncbi:pilus assembly protein [Clostridiales bacterium COT073_COT-073]|nr:pilus assembly protein [Clostridiales bacterium COT073_COT-073]